MSGFLAGRFVCAMAVTRWWWMTLVLVAGSVLATSAWPGQAPERHWLGVNGTDWKRMGPDARLAYVEGFLAGAAVSQAAAGARDSAGVRTGLEQFVAVACGGNFQLSYPLGDAVLIFGLPAKAGAVNR